MTDVGNGQVVTALAVMATHTDGVQVAVDGLVNLTTIVMVAAVSAES